MDSQLLLELILLVVVLIVCRILFLIHKITTGHSKKSIKKRTNPCKTAICIGSGGHTTEMLKLVETLNFDNYNPRHYYVASTDTTSCNKIIELEKRKQDDKTKTVNYEIIKIPRSRVVYQSYLTSIFTTLYSIVCCIPSVLKIRPELVLCNGPGTCIPICGLTFLLKSAFITDTRIVFIESFCRTKTFSLSGKILRFFADNFLIQWPNLQTKLKRAEYIGPLM